MMRMLTSRARAQAAQDLHKKVLSLPAATLTGTTALISGLITVSQGTGKMVPLGDSLQVRTVKVRGESSSESPEATSEKTTSTTGDLLPTGSQDGHNVMEDELRSLD